LRLSVAILAKIAQRVAAANTCAADPVGHAAPRRGARHEFAAVYDWGQQHRLIDEALDSGEFDRLAQ